MAEVKNKFRLLTYALHGKGSYSNNSWVHFTDAAGRVMLVAGKVDYASSFHLDKELSIVEDHLAHANTTVAQLSTALAEAKQVQQAMLHLAQSQVVQEAHAELYGPDPKTGLTAAQEYLAFKQAQREQQPK